MLNFQDKGNVIVEWLMTFLLQHTVIKQYKKLSTVILVKAAINIYILVI